MPKRTIRPSSAKASVRAALSQPVILETLPDGRIVIICPVCSESFLVDNIADVLSGHVTACDSCIAQGRA